MTTKYTPAPANKTTVNDCPLCKAPKGYLCLDECNLNEIIYHKQEIQEIIKERDNK